MVIAYRLNTPLLMVRKRGRGGWLEEKKAKCIFKTHIDEQLLFAL